MTTTKFVEGWTLRQGRGKRCADPARTVRRQCNHCTEHERLEPDRHQRSMVTSARDAPRMKSATKVRTDDHSSRFSIAGRTYSTSGIMPATTKASVVAIPCFHTPSAARFAPPITITATDDSAPPSPTMAHVVINPSLAPMACNQASTRRCCSFQSRGIVDHRLPGARRRPDVIRHLACKAAEQTIRVHNGSVDRRRIGAVSDVQLGCNKLVDQTDKPAHNAARAEQHERTRFDYRSCAFAPCAYQALPRRNEFARRLG